MISRRDLPAPSASQAQTEAQPQPRTPHSPEEFSALLLALQQQSAQRALLEQKLSDSQRQQRQTQAQLVLQTQRATQGAQAQEALAQLQQHHEALVGHLRSIEASTVIRVTRPLVRVKMGLDRWLGRNRPLAPAPATDPLPAPRPQPTHQGQAPAQVDIIVPVYRGLADTQRCVQSVLDCQALCRSSARLILINDASPEAPLTDWLRDVAARAPHIVLLENERNLGFVATVNRGMQLSLNAGHDVLLLNSDTEVANDWLDRLRRAAYSDAHIGTVTPFSTNATICSYPRFCQANPLPEGYSTQTLDALCAQLHAGAVLDIPTAVGFCMYIRRDCLAQVGLFDVENFGLGYGEENDFCQRAAAVGWRNVHALDTFVLHTGGVSFGDHKGPRETAAFHTLQRLHPQYAGTVEAFVRADPARPYRNRLDWHRLQTMELPRVLAVSHAWGGGTQRHLEELAQHLRRQAVFWLLSPGPQHYVRLQWLDPHAGFTQDFHWDNERAEFLALLREQKVGHVHYHHLVGHDPQVMHLHELLGVGYDITAHDYYSACPQISLTTAHMRYCGEAGTEQCRTCLQQRPAPTGESIEEWRLRHRLWLEGARHVFAPSEDALLRMRRYFAQAPLRYVPHTDMLQHPPAPVRVPDALAPGQNLRVFLLGGLSGIKGGDVVEAAALEAARRNVPIEFHLLGYAYRHFRTQPQASLTIHGAYQEGDLLRLIERLQPHVIWLPALWPETYSYTLSACLQAGLPVVATDLGAFPERLQGRAWTWIRPWDTSASQWLAFFEHLRQHHFVTGQAPQVPQVPQVSAALPAGGTPDAQGGGGNDTWSYAVDYCTGLGR